MVISLEWLYSQMTTAVGETNGVSLDNFTMIVWFWSMTSFVRRGMSN